MLLKVSHQIKYIKQNNGGKTHESKKNTSSADKRCYGNAECAIVSQAALVSGADKAQMNMVLLEPDDSQTIKFKEVTANDLSLTKDSEFYVGIKMVNFKNIEEAANYVAGSKGGLNDIAGRYCIQY